MKFDFSLVEDFLLRFEGYAYALFRVVTGLLLVPLGAQKLMGWFGGNRAAIINEFRQMGFEPASFYADLSGGIELVCGAMIVVGLLTRPAALLCTGMLATTILVTSSLGWTQTILPTIWTTASFYILFRGSGPWSIDRLARRSRSTKNHRIAGSNEV